MKKNSPIFGLIFGVAVAAIFLSMLGIKDISTQAGKHLDTNYYQR
jgi:hypothetical protein